MVQCIECGFCEPSKYMGNPSGVCAENPSRPRQIESIVTDIACKKFIEKRRGWELRDVHEWRDRYVNMKWTRRIAVVSLIISIVLGGFSVGYSYLNQQHLEAGLRAELTVLSPQSTWEVEPDFCTLNVSGRIRNEGTRATDVIRVEITINIFNGSAEIVFWNAKEPPALGWQNSTILEKEIRDFSIAMTVMYSPYGFLPDQLPNKGSIKILHYDGISMLEEILTFPFEE